METSSASFTLEQAKVKLSKGGETSIVAAVPSRIRQPATSIIIAHGAGGPMHSPFIRFFHTELAKQGFLSVKFNFPYMEARQKIPDKRDILEECYRTIIEQAQDGKHKPSRTIIGGKSMGGRIASQVAATDKVNIDGLFFLGYPLHPLGKTDQLRDEHLYRIKKPMLFLSGTRDGFARKDLLEKVLKRIGPTAKIHWIENGDHSFKTPGSKPGENDGPHEALSVLLTWLDSISS
ncbi:MAG TPA: alpha/beta family hydrolase [Candidatus Bathyarchaeia archaeon]|nr:alpha/beta family hydrolase [Candidatus Bathyarchaeia archaeon]